MDAQANKQVHVNKRNVHMHTQMNTLSHTPASLGATIFQMHLTGFSETVIPTRAVGISFPFSFFGSSENWGEIEPDLRSLLKGWNPVRHVVLHDMGNCKIYAA